MKFLLDPKILVDNELNREVWNFVPMVIKHIESLLLIQHKLPMRHPK